MITMQSNSLMLSQQKHDVHKTVQFQNTYNGNIAENVNKTNSPSIIAAKYH